MWPTLCCGQASYFFASSQSYVRINLDIIAFYTQMFPNTPAFPLLANAVIATRTFAQLIAHATANELSTLCCHGAVQWISSRQKRTDGLALTLLTVPAPSFRLLPPAHFAACTLCRLHTLPPAHFAFAACTLCRLHTLPPAHLTFLLIGLW